MFCTYYELHFVLGVFTDAVKLIVCREKYFHNGGFTFVFSIKQAALPQHVTG